VITVGQERFDPVKHHTRQSDSQLEALHQNGVTQSKFADMSSRLSSVTRRVFAAFRKSEKTRSITVQ